MPTKRKTHTSTEVKQRWNEKTYKNIRVNLRYDDDAEALEWIEAHRDTYSCTDIFRAGLEVLMKQDT